MRRLAVNLGLAAALGLALGACGGGDSDETAPTTVPTTVAETTTLPPAGNDEASTPFCGLAKTYNEKSGAIATSASDPAKLKAAATDAESAIRRAQAVAPASIKADVAVVAKTAADVLAGLQKSDYVLSKTPEIALIQDQAFQKSFGAVYAYARAHCGL